MLDLEFSENDDDLNYESSKLEAEARRLRVKKLERVMKIRDDHYLALGEYMDAREVADVLSSDDDFTDKHRFNLDNGHLEWRDPRNTANTNYAEGWQIDTHEFRIAETVSNFMTTLTYGSCFKEFIPNDVVIAHLKPLITQWDLST